MTRVHGPACRCADCRHERFNPGPPSNPRRLNWYGHFKRSPTIRRRREAFAASVASFLSVHDPAHRALGWRHLPASIRSLFR